MAKQTGLGDNFYVGAYDLSGDIGAVQNIQTSRALIDTSALTQSGYERLLGRADGQMAFTAYFNPAAGQAHPVLSAVGTASGTAAGTVVSYAHGSTVGNDMASLDSKQVDYNVAVAADQSISVTATAQAANGAPVEWGLMLTSGKQTFASAGSATSTIDGGGATSFGAAATLHAFSIASGTATVAVQDSADNASFTDVSGMTWTVSAAGASRIATTKTATIRRYRRINTSGTFTNLVCALNLVVFPTSQT